MEFLADPQKLKYFVWVIVIIMLWSIPWKAMVLWRTARKGQTGWFIFFMLINSAGIFEIIYLKITKKSGANHNAGELRRQRVHRL